MVDSGQVVTGSVPIARNIAEIVTGAEVQPTTPFALSTGRKADLEGPAGGALFDFARWRGSRSGQTDCFASAERRCSSGRPLASGRAQVNLTPLSSALRPTADGQDLAEHRLHDIGRQTALLRPVSALVKQRALAIRVKNGRPHASFGLYGPGT